jgi:hypothetical protein
LIPEFSGRWRGQPILLTDKILPSREVQLDAERRDKNKPEKTKIGRDGGKSGCGRNSFIITQFLTAWQAGGGAETRCVLEQRYV